MQSRGLSKRGMMGLICLVVSSVLSAAPPIPKDFALQKLDLKAYNQQPYVCVHQSAYLPPLDKEADKWFNEARALEKQRKDRYLTEQEERQINALYIKAAAKNHWKALYNLALRVTAGKGIERNYDRALDLYEKLIALNIP